MAKIITAYIEDSMYDNLSKYAKEFQSSKGSIVRIALSRFFKNEKLD